MSTDHGRITLTGPTVAATLTAPDGSTVEPDAGDFALPGPYTCQGGTATSPGELNVVVLHRIGPPG
jgi:hypothetical protein